MFAGNVFTVGTAVATVAPMSVDGQTVVVQNIESIQDVESMARDGNIYLIGQKFNLTAAGVLMLNVATGSRGLQIEGYEIGSTTENVFAELIEGATVTVTGSEIPAYNLSRNHSDDYDSVFKAVLTSVGGTTFSAELITASKAAGGGGQFGKIHTLAPNSNYVMKFTNLGNQTTTVFVQIAFAERFNSHTDVWLNGTVGDGYRLCGGESVKIETIAGQSVTAISSGEARVSVLRQD